MKLFTKRYPSQPSQDVFATIRKIHDVHEYNRAALANRERLMKWAIFLLPLIVMLLAAALHAEDFQPTIDPVRLVEEGMTYKGFYVENSFKVVQKVSDSSYLIAFKHGYCEEDFFYLIAAFDKDWVTNQKVTIVAKVIGTYTYQAVLGSNTVVKLMYVP